MSKWISVKDRLPENERWVLCYRLEKQRPIVDWYSSFNRQWAITTGSTVTHWMDLPEKPES